MFFIISDDPIDERVSIMLNGEESDLCFINICNSKVRLQRNICIYIYLYLFTHLHILLIRLECIYNCRKRAWAIGFSPLRRFNWITWEFRGWKDEPPGKDSLGLFEKLNLKPPDTQPRHGLIFILRSGLIKVPSLGTVSGSEVIAVSFVILFSVD